MKTKQIEDITEIENIIHSLQVCNVGFVNNNMPYVLPFNFGYNNKTIYLHSKKEGTFINILSKNNNVCVSFATDNEMVIRNESVACSYTMKYKSVLAFGKAFFVNDFDKKIEGLNHIMKQYTGNVFSYNKPAVNNIQVIKIEIDKITGRSRGY